MRIAICEDNTADRTFICQYIEQYCNQNAYECNIEAFESGEALLADMRSNKYHIIFLDIYLPGITGMVTAQQIREIDSECALVFITTSMEHALESFGVAAAFYIVKPIENSKLDKAFKICRRIFEEHSRVLNIPQNGSTLSLPLSQIFYIEVNGKNTIFYLKKCSLKARIPLEKVELELGGLPFLRCHRSYIVNMNYIDLVEERALHMHNGQIVPIRKNGAKQVHLQYACFLAGAKGGR